MARVSRCAAAASPGCHEARRERRGRVSGERSTQWHRAFEKTLPCRQCIDWQNEATGVRGGIAEEYAAGEVFLIDAMSISVRLKKASSPRMSCARAKASITSIDSNSMR
jgi:hypothetical protein